jgi:hypothetical protein
VADQNGWVANPSQRPSYRGEIAFIRIEAVLGGHHFIPIRLKRGDYLVKARALGPDPVAEHDAGFGLHDVFSSNIG